MKKNNLKYIAMCFVVFAGFWPQNAVATMLVVTPMSPACKDFNMTISQSKKFAKKYALMRIKQIGWTDHEWKSLLTLWSKESRWDHTANNPHSSAYGIPQILNMPEDTPLTEQVELGLKYIKKRYKTPTLALQHHLRKGWY
jgi:hypothetical protein